MSVNDCYLTQLSVIWANILDFGAKNDDKIYFHFKKHHFDILTCNCLSWK